MFKRIMIIKLTKTENEREYRVEGERKEKNTHLGR